MFDPALDCVARSIDGTPDPRRYRGELPLRCGSPLYPVDARRVPASELESTVAAMKQRFTAPIEIALGTAEHGGSVVVVIAGRLVVIEPFHRGDSLIRGQVTLDLPGFRLYVSRADGVTASPVTLEGRAFALPVPTGDTDLELAIVVSKEEGPAARFRVGRGSPLFARGTRVLELANAARKRLGLEALASIKAPQDCDTVPAKVGGEDVTGTARCYDIPDLDVDALSFEIATSPLIQSRFLDPRAAFLEIGPTKTGVSFRVTQRFETMTPDAARARVLAKYRTRWPDLVERPAPAGALAAVLEDWRANGDITKGPTEWKPALDRIAASWTPTPRYFSALSTSRDLDVAIELTKPDSKPLAIDAAVIQARDQTGAMRDLVAVILVLP